jgi:nitrogen regulatory protein PII
LPPAAPWLRIEITCSHNNLQKVVDTILQAAPSGEIGVGKICVCGLQNVIRIRAGVCMPLAYCPAQ